MPRAQLAERFSALWQRLGADDGADVAAAGARLLDLYVAPHRAYHNLTHLEDVLAKLDWAQSTMMMNGELSGLDGAERRRLFDTIELALFYHDAIYDAQAKDNEAQSRERMKRDAATFGIDAGYIEDAARLIDTTAHHASAARFDEKIMSDCDLAILGADEASFKRYDDGIRAEYAHVPAPLYAAGRAKVLQGFLDMPHIFKTRAFADVFDAPARRNLGGALAPQSSLPILGRLKKLIFKN